MTALKRAVMKGDKYLYMNRQPRNQFLVSPAIAIALTVLIIG